VILLDTNVLSELMKPAPELAVVQWLDAQLDSQVFLPAITKAEIELGIALLPNGKRQTQGYLHPTGRRPVRRVSGPNSSL